MTDLEYLQLKLKIIQRIKTKRRRKGDAEYRLIRLINQLKDIELVKEYLNLKIKYYEYGFECPDISKVKNKNKLYNDIMNTFEEQLKEWIYG